MVVSAPVWVPIAAVEAVLQAGLRTSRRVRGWYNEAWYGHGPGDTSPDLARGDRVTAKNDTRLHLSKVLPDVVEQPRRPAYRVRPSGIHQPRDEYGPKFEARSAEILEVVPGWRAFGPRGEAVLALLDEAMALPLEAYRSFVLSPPDPKLVLEGLKASPLHREASRAALQAWSAVSQDKAPGDPASGEMEHGSPVWYVKDVGWRHATRAVQLAAIEVVVGGQQVDPTHGWEDLRGERPESNA